MVILLFLIVFLQGCRSPKPPVPEPPEPNPVEKVWEDYYPEGHTIPLIDFMKIRWQERNFKSSRWLDYENKNVNFMIDEDRKDKYDELTLANLLTHKENGRYFFTWTSDVVTFANSDYLAPPAEYGLAQPGLGACDDLAGAHCDYLYRLSQYWLVWWIEVYWKRKYWNDVSNSYQWKNLGHAITILKRTPESNWKCFSNNSFLGMTNGFDTFEEIIYKFVPLNVPSQADNYKLTKVVAREPVTGKLLFEWRS